ncbi:techylectin-5B-like [Limulus polyphemus]|uniref:Techylectin-5B-like n=1 Tax=Limulus polyphemus TaxID=6850 RepID=A0ABM1B2R0_LIMPO|nr:techylectin-5B-like [Limulus polyphemus]
MSFCDSSKVILYCLVFTLLTLNECQMVGCNQRRYCERLGSIEGILHSLSLTTSQLVDLAANNIKELKDVDSCTRNRCSTLPQDCSNLLNNGHHQSGIYEVWPRFLNESVFVWCDMQHSGGGWTVIQRRGDYGNDPLLFYKPWNDYKQGFGNISEEFWLGNDNIFALTNQDSMELVIYLENFEGGKRYAMYSNFLVRSEREMYRMSYENYEGNAGDAMDVHNHKNFSTFDHDNDLKNSEPSCAEKYKAGWWFAVCHKANLNGPYERGLHEPTGRGVNWEPWMGLHYSLKSVEMKIRPKK